MIQQARWHISCDRVFRMRSGVKRQSSLVRTWTLPLLKRRHLDLPLESRILVASSIEVVCTPSLDLFDKQIEPTPKAQTYGKSGGSPMPSSTASGGQKAGTPDQRRLDRKTASKDGPIELVKERSRIGGPLRLFRLRQCLFRRSWRFRPRRFRRRSRFERSSRWLVVIVRLVLLWIWERRQRREGAERSHEAVRLFVCRTRRIGAGGSRRLGRTS